MLQHSQQFSLLNLGIKPRLLLNALCWIGEANNCFSWKFSCFDKLKYCRVLIGKWLSNKISPSKFALFTGALMIIISLFLALIFLRITYKWFKFNNINVHSFYSWIGRQTQLATLTISGTSKTTSSFRSFSTCLCNFELWQAVLFQALPEVVLNR